MSNETDKRTAFEALYEADRDPWNVETSDYERRKRAATLAALPDGRFAHVLDIGCSTGVLTAELVPLADRLVAIDVAENALRAARSRVENGSHVTFVRGEVPRDWPAGRFDLILFSEVLYFLSAEDVARASRRAWESLDPGGACLLINWTGPNDLPVDGPRAVEIFKDSAGWAADLRQEADQYRIDRLRKQSSAQGG